MANLKSRNTGKSLEERDGRSSIYWPQPGDTIKKLIATQQVRVFVDASFIKSPFFSLFAKEWHANRIPPLSTRYFFIPSFEIKKLTEQELSNLIAEDYRERPGDDYSSCFERMLDQGLKWNVVLLTESSEEGYAAQLAARSKEFQLRWYGINEIGQLRSLRILNRNQSSNSHINNLKKKEKPFKVTTELADIRRTVNPASIVPISGSMVTTEHNGIYIYIKEALMTDHVSITYATDNAGYYAKIYTVKSLQLDIWENKAKRMLQETVEIPGVCWPVDILKNMNGQFVGILVPASKGVQLTRSVLNGATGLAQYFPEWDKKDLCSLAETILDKICKIHNWGLYFGCLNPATIYVVNSQDVYFVDTDSWQIEGYPAISRNQTFTPPEILRRNEPQILYTADQENYQIALLTFMLMLPGKFPYTKSLGIDERESIIKMSFPFSVGGGMRRSIDAERPSGIWRIVWDHLPYEMCNSFYNSFHSDGKYATPDHRIEDTAWLRMIKDFSSKLNNSKSIDSRNIFPHTFRRDGKRKFVQCNICGQEHPDFYFMRSIRLQKETINIWDRGYRVCLPCANDQSKKPDAHFKCECCGRTFYYTNRAEIIHKIGKSDFDWENQKWCKTCKKRTVTCSRCHHEGPIYQMKVFEDKLRNLKTNVCSNCFKEMIENAKREREAWKNGIYKRITCRICGRIFSITNGEYEYFRKKRLDLPARCLNCRNRGY